MWKNSKYIFLIGFILILISFLWLRNEKQTISYSDFAMDSFFKITIYGSSEKKIALNSWEEVKKVELLLDRYGNDSELRNLNDKAAFSPVLVSEELYKVLKNCFTLYYKTDRSFNPAIGPLVDLWRPFIYQMENAIKPTERDIQTAKLLIEPDLIKLNDENRSVFFEKMGVSLDFGAIGKGYAVDKVLEYLKKNNIKSAIVDCGGTIGVYGEPPKGRVNWKIAIKHPRKEGIIGVLKINENMVISTSGDYERYFEDKGYRYHHIIDPKTGYPTSDLVSVTIVSDSGIYSDALSTAIMVMGLEKGLTFLEDNNIIGVLIASDNKIFLSKAAEKFFEHQTK